MGKPRKLLHLQTWSRSRLIPFGSSSKSADEVKLAELQGLDDEQLYWRRLKIAELRNEDLFKREYPLTPDEAFMASNFDSFITADLVFAARKEDIETIWSAVDRR